MRIRPIHLTEANEFVRQYHRHNLPTVGGKFAIACYLDDELIGVAIGGRPVAQKLDNGKTFEIYRVCTIGFKNSTSFLYSRMKRIAQLMGYEKFITFTLQSEPGTSLKAIGAKVVAEVKHKKYWNDYKAVKRKKQPVTLQLKFRWEL